MECDFLDYSSKPNVSRNKFIDLFPAVVTFFARILKCTLEVTSFAQFVLNWLRDKLLWAAIEQRNAVF